MLTFFTFGRRGGFAKTQTHLLWPGKLCMRFNCVLHQSYFCITAIFADELSHEEIELLVELTDQGAIGLKRIEGRIHELIVVGEVSLYQQGIGFFIVLSRTFPKKHPYRTDSIHLLLPINPWCAASLSIGDIHGKHQLLSTIDPASQTG